MPPGDLVFFGTLAAFVVPACLKLVHEYLTDQPKAAEDPLWTLHRRNLHLATDPHRTGRKDRCCDS